MKFVIIIHCGNKCDLQPKEVTNRNIIKMKITFYTYTGKFQLKQIIILKNHF